MEILMNRRRRFMWLQYLLVLCVLCASTVTCQPGYLSIDCGSKSDYPDNETGISWETDASYIYTGKNLDILTNCFLSIDCGSYTNYTDNETGIFWETDGNYINTGKNLENMVRDDDPSYDPVFVNKRQAGTIRYFDDSRSRDCYVLPVQQGETYLIRLTIYFGNLLTIYTNGSFGVWVDSNNFLNLRWNNANVSNSSYRSTEYDSVQNVVHIVYTEDISEYLYQMMFSLLRYDTKAGCGLRGFSEPECAESRYYFSNYYEIIYSARRSTLNVCLARFHGPSLISAMELRQLATGMYAAAVGPTLSSWLVRGMRYNLGPHAANGTVQQWRYPNDTYDRIWGLLAIDLVISNQNILGSSTSFALNPDRPPLVVMQDAWTPFDQVAIAIVMTNDSDNPRTDPPYIATYFQELDGNASATNVRGMSYYVNNVFIESFNISENVSEIIMTKISPDRRWINISLEQANWSRLGPSLNAFELYDIFPWDSSTTTPEDVTGLYALQVRLNLLDWTGDPCLPSAFDWLSCSYVDASPRITSLSLANQGFEGNIPIEISNLRVLTKLILNDNNFNGSIPDFSNLVHLQIIQLQNNNLSGQIPNFLGNAFPNLTKLNLNDNNLDGTVPSNLIRPGLNFTVLNNPSIVNCTVSACGYVPPAPPIVGTSSARSSSTRAVVGGVLGGSVAVAIAIVAGIVWMICTRKRRTRLSIVKAIEQAENHNTGPLNVSRKVLGSCLTLLTLQEVSDATSKFSKKIGEGSFGPVYYGKLSDGQEVAVKVKKTYSRSPDQGAVEFLNEVDLLSRIHHKNLVSLIGYCEEENQQILIFVYFSEGTLRDHLYGDELREHLDWSTRLDIALNAAKGLEYLHTDCHPRIIHRDVKSSNILLDEYMVAKVADFGISKEAPDGVFSGVHTMLRGTIGYVDPVYFATQKLTHKSDVYSFGIVLLEMIAGRHPYVSEFPDGTSMTLVEWVSSAVDDGRAMDVIDPSLNRNFKEGSMMKVISLAISSIDPVMAKRPNMAQVVRTLAEAVELKLSSEVINHPDREIVSANSADTDGQNDPHLNVEPIVV